MFDNISDLRTRVRANGDVYYGYGYFGYIVRNGHEWSAYVANEEGAGDTFLSNYPTKVIATDAVYNAAYAETVDTGEDLYLLADLFD